MLPKIMIVDDCEIQRYLTETTIEKYLHPAEIVAFDSSIGALTHLQALENNYHEFPSVIFLDINMPVMSGFDFLDEYLAFSRYSREHCEIVMLSSTDDEEDYVRVNKYPVIYKFLSKPLTPQKLMSLNSLWESKIAMEMFSSAL